MLWLLTNLILTVPNIGSNGYGGRNSNDSVVLPVPISGVTSSRSGLLYTSHWLFEVKNTEADGEPIPKSTVSGLTDRFGIKYALKFQSKLLFIISLQISEFLTYRKKAPKVTTTIWYRTICK